jgi:hypothetical protein
MSVENLTNPAVGQLWRRKANGHVHRVFRLEGDNVYSDEVGLGPEDGLPRNHLWRYSRILFVCCFERLDDQREE